MKTCRVCGKQSETMPYMGPLCSKECHSAAFWDEKVALRGAGDVTSSGAKVARISGTHYILGKQGSGVPSDMRGMAGREHFIRFTSGPHSGQTVRCCDLWYQGEIPGDYRDRLPDNAEFVEKAVTV